MINPSPYPGPMKPLPTPPRRVPPDETSYGGMGSTHGGWGGYDPHRNIGITSAPTSPNMPLPRAPVFTSPAMAQPPDPTPGPAPSFLNPGAGFGSDDVMNAIYSRLGY